MKKYTMFLIITCAVVSTMVLAGCNVILPPTTYEAKPTKIQYSISYGYFVNCSGSGRYEVMYRCDVPSVLLGSTTYQLMHSDDYTINSSLQNTHIYWNISGDDERQYRLGITAQITAETFLIADLNGENALSIQALKEMFPTIVHQYTQVQGDQTTRFIDPYDPQIKTIAMTVKEQAKTNNSFIIAQLLFSWLKNNIIYQTHPGEEEVRPAAITLEKGNGDCDDLSFLFISMCRSVGIPARFIRGYLITASGNDDVSATAHAWVEVFVGAALGNNGWIPIECACRTTDCLIDIQQNFGVEDCFHLRLFVDDGSNSSLDLSRSEISSVIYGSNRLVEITPFVSVDGYLVSEEKKLIITRDNIRYYE